MKSKINNNDLSHWFLRDHATLPAAYVKSCREFFDKIKQTPEAPYKNFFWPTVPQRQAASNKQQAKSHKLQAPQNLHMPGRRVKNRFKRKI
jgi:hypothetical protein